MRVIKQANTNISNLLGEQRFEKAIKYRKFSQAFFLSNDMHYIAYNMLTRELIELSCEEFNKIERYDFDNENDNVLQETLAKKWFLVPFNNDDFCLCRQVVEFLKIYNIKKNINFFSILTTTDCNARCFYCYEYGLEKKEMTNEIANDVSKYLIKKANGEKIKIRWFGGEPLCNVDAINTIADSLQKSGASFESSMVTNGYLFDRDLIYRAKHSWNLKSVQITLDGTEKIYNNIKNYIEITEKSPFDIVISNILDLIQNDIYVTIRMNFDKHNKEDICKLAKFLTKTLPSNGKCSVYMHLLYDNSGNVQFHRTDESLEDLMETYEKVNNVLAEANLLLLRKLPNMPKIRACMADDDSAVLILPDGRITKCEHSLDHDIIGSIYSEQFDKSIVESWKKTRPDNERCKNCPVWLDCRTLEKCETNKHCYKIDQINKCREYERMIWREYYREASETKET